MRWRRRTRLRRLLRGNSSGAVPLAPRAVTFRAKAFHSACGRAGYLQGGGSERLRRPGDFFARGLEQSFHSACGRAGNFSLLVQRKVTKRNHVRAEHALWRTRTKLRKGINVPCTTGSRQVESLLSSFATKQAKRATPQFRATELYIESSSAHTT